MRGWLVALVVIVGCAVASADSVNVTVSIVEPNVYLVHHPEGEVYLVTDGCDVQAQMDPA